MAKVTLRGNASGRYFVSGRGFVGTQAEATVLSADKANEVQSCVAEVGGEPSSQVAVVEGKSFAVSFIRGKDLNGDGSIKTNKRNPSKRRFATPCEARQHGSRFVQIEKHLGFYVTETTDPVNAWINKANGKTNPEIGKARTNR